MPPVEVITSYACQCVVYSASSNKVCIFLKKSVPSEGHLNI